MALIAVSVYLAALSRSDSRLLREELASLRRSVELPDISPAQRQAYQQIWHALGDQAGRPRPWVLLSQDTGEFGYMPAAAARAGGRTGPVLLRCVLATSLGRRVGVVSLILPAGPDLKLSVPGAAELLGLPVACEVSSQDDRSAAVALTVGGGAGMEAGVRGRVTLDGAWVEIGQFQLNGQRLRVAVQALPLDRTVG
jgi:hypothetical protein